MKMILPFLLAATLLNTISVSSFSEEKGSDREIQALKEEIQKLREELVRQNREIERLKAGQKETPAAPGVQASPAVALPDRDEAKALVSELLDELYMEEKKQSEEEKGLVTSYDDGFVFKGKDDLLKIGGWLQADFRQFESGHPGDSGFLVRGPVLCSAAGIRPMRFSISRVFTTPR